jgi:hypothetical protein
MLHSFCESQWATGVSPWHIRQLTKKGLMLGGGADTKALCGRTVAWDLDIPLTEMRLRDHGSCRECVAILKKQPNAASE